MINIRQATIDDLPQIVTIYNQAVPSHIVTDDSSPISIASRKKWFTQFDPTHPLWVAEENNHVCGWCALENFFAHPAYQFSAEIAIYLDKQWQQQGLGKRLLKYIDQQVESTLQLKTVVAYVYERNLPSQKLFTCCGYKQWGSLPQISQVAGEMRTLLIYGKHFNQ